MEEELIDALCQRSCTFALYREQQGQEVFCMQENGGAHPFPAAKSFALAAYHASPRFIAEECSSEPDPTRFALLPPRFPHTPATTRKDYHHLFSQYTQWLHGEGALGKIVLARTRDIPCSAPSPARLYAAACRTAPGEFQALVHTPDSGTWICSTPEILLKGKGDSWQTMSLAGTRPVSKKPWDPKNLAEQRMVTDSICHTLSRLGCSWEMSSPSSTTSGAIEHLCTRIRFRLPASNILRMLSQLQPTPAVSGYPREKAMARIASHPDIHRGYYAGYMGRWQTGNISLYVTLRCMQIYHDRCRLYAGGGLLPDSDEEAEWQETELKMQPMLHLLNTSR